MKIENFEGFFRKYEKFSVKIAYRALRNKENAEDVCQDVFIHFYKILDYLDLSNEKMLESLIYTATMNKCRDFIKKSRRKRESYMAEEEMPEQWDEESDPARIVFHREERKEEIRISRHLMAKLYEVNPVSHDIFVKTKLLEIPPDIVAEEYGLTRNSVNNRNMRTKAWLNKEYKKLSRQP